MNRRQFLKSALFTTVGAVVLSACKKTKSLIGGKMKTKKIELSEISKQIDPIVAMRETNWFLVTARDKDGTNTLTAAWGAFGNVWEKKTVTIYIRPQRYTKKFIDNSGEFTLTFFDGYLKEMGYLGSNSGRDVPDKIEKSGLHLIDINNKPTYEEGKLVLVCKTLYREALKPENFIERSFAEQTYPDKDYSVMYIAEITDAYLIEH
jgi:hypothetical protein